MRGVIVVAALLALTGSSQAQVRPEDTGGLSAAWARCVTNSARGLFAQGYEKNLAVETAFGACATEEQVMFMPLATMPPGQIEQYRAAFRLKVKQNLIGRP